MKAAPAGLTRRVVCCDLARGESCTRKLSHDRSSPPHATATVLPASTGSHSTRALSECSLDRTTFTRCEIVRTNFARCTFRDASFTGALRTVNFTRCTAVRVDLRGCRIVDSSLLDGPDLDLRLPDAPDNFVAYPRAFAAAVDALGPVLSRAGHEELRSVAAFVAGSTHGEIVDETLLARIPAAERGVVLEQLFALRNLRA